MIDYYWILSLHIVAVLSWMAMLFYLPRLFVYHVENADKKEFVEVVKIQEYKIYKYIGNPAMYVTIASGIIMLIMNPALFGHDWIYAKIVVLIFLVAYSISLEKFRKQLEQDIYIEDGKFFRMYNEVPTMLAILIVTYAITKHFSLFFTVVVILVFTLVAYMILNKKEDNKNENSGVEAPTKKSKLGAIASILRRKDKKAKSDE